MRNPFVAGVLTTILLLGMLVASSLGCKKNKAPLPVPREITGLDALPRDTRAVIGVNVLSLRGSWLVRRAIEQMFRRDPGLEQRIEQLIRDCRFDPSRDLDSFLIGIGGQGSDPELHEAVMVVTGTFLEAELASCVGQGVASDGGHLTAQKVDGRTFYNVSGRSGRRDDVWFTISGQRTLVVATSSEWLAKAVGDGEKLAASPSMAALLDKVDQKAGVWAVGEVDERIGAGLVGLTGGAVGSPPRAMFAQGELKAGVNFMLGAEMGSENDANALLSLMKGQISLGALAAQRYGLGTLISKLGVDSEGKTVYLRFSLSEDEVRQILSQIDTPTGSTQNPAEN